jgi:phosphopantothenate synthetase
MAAKKDRMPRTTKRDRLSVNLFYMPNRTKRNLLVSVMQGRGPVNGCKIGTQCPILHAKLDLVHPIGFSDADVVLLDLDRWQADRQTRRTCACICHLLVRAN